MTTVALTISANLDTSACGALESATGSSAFTLAAWTSGAAGATLATVTFAGSAYTCTLSTQAGFTLSAGQLYCWTGPATADATLGDVVIGLYGTHTLP